MDVPVAQLNFGTKMCQTPKVSDTLNIVFPKIALHHPKHTLQLPDCPEKPGSFCTEFTKSVLKKLLKFTLALHLIRREESSPPATSEFGASWYDVGVNT